MKCFYLADKEKPRPKKVAACSITIFNYGLSSCRIIRSSVFVCFMLFPFDDLILKKTIS